MSALKRPTKEKAGQTHKQAGMEEWLAFGQHIGEAGRLGYKKSREGKVIDQKLARQRLKNQEYKQQTYKNTLGKLAQVTKR